jgi:hypothetical protein
LLNVRKILIYNNQQLQTNQHKNPMSKSNPIADRLRAQAQTYERMSQQAATESVAELFRHMASECLGAEAEESTPSDEARKLWRSGSDGN